MTEKDNIWDGILKIGLVLGGIWLGSEILKDLSEEEKDEE